MRRLTSLRRCVLALTIVAAAVAGENAYAGSVTFNVSGTNGSEPVSGSATFTTSNGQLKVTLTDTVPNPNGVASILGGTTFNIVGGGTGSVISSAGLLIDIGSQGTVTTPTADQSTQAINSWAITASSANGTTDYKLRASGNDPLIIGAPDSTGAYSNGNGSITNGSHNPYFQNTATFTINIAGLTDNSTVSDVAFLWGTTYSPAGLVTTSSGGFNVSGPATPAPAAVYSGASLVAGLGLIAARRKRLAV